MFLGLMPFILQKRLLRNSLTVFVFHDINKHPSDFSLDHSLNISPNVFDYQIKYIKNNFNVISPKHILERTLPENSALVTFDDGFKSFFTNVIPILNKYKIPALIFINMGPIKGETFWPGLIAYLCSRRNKFIEYLNQQLKSSNVNQPILECTKSIVDGYIKNTNEDFNELVSDYVGNFANDSIISEASDNPYVFYGNHTYTHYISSHLSNNEFLNDVKKNYKLLKKFPNYLNIFAFPFGMPESTFNNYQVKLLTDSGAKRIFYSSGTNINRLPPDSLLDRISLDSKDDTNAKIRYKVFRPWLIYIRNLFHK